MEIIACAPHRVGWDHPNVAGLRTGRNVITGVTTHVAVKIRLKRFGKIRSPHYRIVVADSRTKRDGRAIEEIGKYHPKNDPSVIEVDSERAQYWLSVGAQPTEAVIALLKRTGDWQKYSGDASPSGVLPQPEKPNKTDAFNAALAEAGQEPRAPPAGLRKSPRPSRHGVGPGRVRWKAPRRRPSRPPTLASPRRSPASRRCFPTHSNI